MRQTFELAQVLLVSAFRLAWSPGCRGPVAVGRRLVWVEPETVLVVRHVSPGRSCAWVAVLRTAPVSRSLTSYWATILQWEDEGRTGKEKKHKIWTAIGVLFFARALSTRYTSLSLIADVLHTNKHSPHCDWRNAKNDIVCNLPTLNNIISSGQRVADHWSHARAAHAYNDIIYCTYDTRTRTFCRAQRHVRARSRGAAGVPLQVPPHNNETGTGFCERLGWRYERWSNRGAGPKWNSRARRSHTAGRRTAVGGDGPWDAGLASCTAAAAGSPYMELHYTRRLPPMIFHRNGSSAIL